MKDESERAVSFSLSHSLLTLSFILSPSSFPLHPHSNVADMTFQFVPELVNLMVYRFVPLAKVATPLRVQVPPLCPLEEPEVVLNEVEELALNESDELMLNESEVMS